MSDPENPGNPVIEQESQRNRIGSYIGELFDDVAVSAPLFVGIVGSEVVLSEIIDKGIQSVDKYQVSTTIGLFVISYLESRYIKLQKRLEAAESKNPT